MGSGLFTFLVLAVLTFQNGNAQNVMNYHSIRYNHYRRPVVFISSGSGITRTYVPPPIRERDVGSTRDAKKIQLDVYYATDCPDSMRFITSQLYPVYQEFEDSLEIQLIPYGKAHKSYNENTKKYEFRCQHGPAECFGNAIQSCVMSLYPKEKDYLNFINCMERYPRPSMNGRKCARRLSLDWDKIDKCARGDEGNRLMNEMAQKTENLNPPLYFVPWIVVDKVFNERTQRMALRNLRSVICEAYKGTHPKCGQRFF